MKKIVLVLIVLLMCGCNQNKNDLTDTKKEYSIIGSWERKTEDNTETINLLENGHFSYHGADGNPIDDYDLCESFQKNENIIELNCDDGISNETDAYIEVIEVSEKELKLKFNEEVRTFKKVEEVEE